LSEGGNQFVRLPPKAPHLLLQRMSLFVEMAEKRQMKNVMTRTATVLMDVPGHVEFRSSSSVWDKRGRHLSAGGSVAMHGSMIKKNVMMGMTSVEMDARVTVEWRRGSHVRVPAV
jgi:hypothetical protein